jgi:DDE superfamily endonuclease
VNATLSCPVGGRQAEAGFADEATAALAGFRGELYRCLGPWGDALFGVADAVLCAGGRVTDLARLSLVAGFGRGHGSVYGALNDGGVDVGRLQRLLAGEAPPRWRDGGIRLGIDVSSWLRPDAEASPGRMFCHVPGRGRSSGQVTPGWPYSFVAALGPGRSSWTAVLDARRIGPGDDESLVAAEQLRGVVGRLREAGHWKPGDPPVIIAMDSGYHATRLAWLLRDLPVIVVARIRSVRVYRRPAPPRLPGTRGRGTVHGAPFRCADPATHGAPGAEQDGERTGHGPVAVTAWHRLHQEVHRNVAGFEDWPRGEDLPVIEGTVIRISAPGGAKMEPMWLWAGAAEPDAALLRGLWQAYLRRFDLEHTFRFLKQQLGWTRPLLRDPGAADRWTWLLLAALAQLRLARGLAAVARLPWQRPQPPAEMTPARVRAGFRRARETVGTPASAAKPSGAGPGRPKGSKNKRKAPRHPVGKTNPKKRKRGKTKQKTPSPAG